MGQNKPLRQHPWYTTQEPEFMFLYADDGPRLFPPNYPKSPWPRPKKTEAQLWQEDYEQALKFLESDF